jgi:hypothetical protein
MKYEDVDVGDPNAAEAPEAPFTFAKPEYADLWRSAYAAESRSDGALSGADLSSYARCSYVLAARWARRIENEIDMTGRSPEEVLKDSGERSCIAADESKGMGVTGFQHRLTIRLLAAYWVHGHILRGMYPSVVSAVTK